MTDKELLLNFAELSTDEKMSVTGGEAKGSTDKFFEFLKKLFS